MDQTMTKKQQAENLWKQYRDYVKQIERYRQVCSLFDFEIRSLAPKGSVKNKMEIIQYFSQESFKLATAPEYGALLDQMADPEVYAEFDEAQKITVDRKRRAFKESQAIPADFESEYGQTLRQTERIWEEARTANDFDAFAPYLEKNIAMNGQRAKYLHPEMDVYDALLFDHQNGVDCEMTDKLFSELKEGLVPLLRQIQARGEKETPNCDKLTASAEVNMKLQDALLRYLGFDFNRGTTGYSMHGLTGMMDEDDVRITNNYEGRNPINVMLTAIHEGGHALYNQNVDPKYRGTSVAELRFADIHESQSRFLENMLGRNINFWKPIYPELCEICPALKEISLEELDAYINKVKTGPVRIQADDLTYCLHIILRFELEKVFFHEPKTAYELRDMWNQKTEEMLGVKVENDANGIMQDIHWSSVYFGYFPSYLIGSIYDAMFRDAAEADLGDLGEIMAQGRIREITAWLKEKIYRNGALYNGPQLIQHVCRKPLSAQPLLKYFQNKYGN